MLPEISKQDPNIDWAAVETFMANRRVRFERKIYPADVDQIFFDRHSSQSRGRWRIYHARPSLPLDHWLFCVAGQPTKGAITIVGREPAIVAVMAADELRFGALVNSDAYAAMRLEAMSAEERTRLREGGDA
jgi:hypothetical protein